MTETNRTDAEDNTRQTSRAQDNTTCGGPGPQGIAPACSDPQRGAHPSGAVVPDTGAGATDAQGAIPAKEANKADHS